MFDMRFLVVYDRYPNQFKRTIEALKHRYYSIARILTELKYEARINSEMAKIQNINAAGNMVTASGADGAAPTTATTSPLYSQTMAVVNKLRDERARDPILKFVYSPSADIDRKQHIHKMMTKTSAHKLNEKQIVETVKKQISIQHQQQNKQQHKTGTQQQHPPSRNNNGTTTSTPPSVRLSSAEVDNAKTAGERQRSDLIDSTLDEKVPQTSAASLRLVCYPYTIPMPTHLPTASPSPPPFAPASTTQQSSHLHIPAMQQQPCPDTATADSTTTPPLSTAVSGPVGTVGVPAASKQHAETTGLPVSSSVWLQPYHIFTLHTSTYFPFTCVVRLQRLSIMTAVKVLFCLHHMPM
eukprot:GHVS01050584.1.p1 GENE.GHVS01050584.1~~GHVS01050584.1.p1  ORF type:complete len:410 (+),score=80.66 GHVS01050584.1:170-1231(+)